MQRSDWDGVLDVAGMRKQKGSVETFETTWTVINETFPYEDFNGTDWNEVHDTYLPLAKKTKTAEELKPILHDMLSELNVSHMAVIPEDEFTVMDQTSPEEDSDADPSTSTDDEQIEQGWVGLSARWIEEQLIVTSVDGRDDVQMR